MKYALTAKRIKEAMDDMQISQQELADRSQIGKSSISHYVNGTNEPGNKSAYMLAQVLKVNPAWLMGLDAPKHLPIEIEVIKNSEEAEIEKALDLYRKYIKAIPQVREAVEALLKPQRPDS